MMFSVKYINDTQSLEHNIKNPCCYFLNLFCNDTDMNNITSYNYTEAYSNNLRGAKDVIYIDDSSTLISSISLAVCSILLSLTGFFVALQKSKCKVIKICRCLTLERNLNSEN